MHMQYMSSQNKTVFVTGVYATKYQNSKKRERKKKITTTRITAKFHQLQIVRHPLSKPLTQKYQLKKPARGKKES